MACSSEHPAPRPVRGGQRRAPGGHRRAEASVAIS